MKLRYTDAERKYGRDHGSRMTIDELSDRMIQASRKGSDSLCDEVDRYLTETYAMDLNDPESHYFYKDLRGLIFNLCNRIPKIRSIR
jgi:hypothetical protein